MLSPHINPLRQNLAVHRITAKVRFTATSGLKARTLRLVYPALLQGDDEARFIG